MGQADVRARTDELLAMLVDDDPFGVDAFATHHLPLSEAPDAYEHFQKKEEGMVKVVFRPRRRLPPPRRGGGSPGPPPRRSRCTRAFTPGAARD